jgi:hypothetical protein
MSHFTRIRTQMVERRFITRSLADLGHKFEEGEVRVRGFMGRQTPAEIRVPTEAAGYDIGFARSNGHYEVVADWWGVRGVKRETFIAGVTQRYAYHAARERLEEQGFALVEERKEAGRIHLVLRRVG